MSQTPLNQLPVVVYYVGPQQFIAAVTPAQKSANDQDGPRFRVTSPCLVHAAVSQDPAKQGEIQVQMIPVYLQELQDTPSVRPEFVYPANIVVETNIKLNDQLVQAYRNTLVPPVQPTFEPIADAPGAAPVVKSLFD